jgi:hypothetical protein
VNTVTFTTEILSPLAPGLIRRADVISRPDIRDQVPVLMNDAIRPKAPRFVKSVEEGRKNRSESGCGSVICIESRFRRNLGSSNEIALLKRHRLLLAFVGVGATAHEAVAVVTGVSQVSQQR